MNYLILGGTGFIGTHLADKLVDEGHTVTVIDSCITSEKHSKHAYPKLITHNFDICSTYIGHATLLDALIKKADIVYFLAGSVGVKNVVENPQSTMMNNIKLAMTLIPIFDKYKPKVIFTSTSEVYGEGPFKEDGYVTVGEPTNLRWSYASAKLTTEFMITTGNFPYVIVRLFNITGPGQVGDYGMVLPRFIAAAKANNDLIIHGTGDSIRSFCHVEDAINMIRQLESLDKGIFNIGSNSYPVTIRYLAEAVIRLTDSTSSIVCTPLSEVYQHNYGDISRRIPDLTKLKSVINYETSYSLNDIIKSML